MASDPNNFITQQTVEELAASDDAHRAQGRKLSIQRLQIGVFGLCAMALLVGLANILQNSAAEIQASSVEPSVPALSGGEEIAPMRDPLADAGVVPELPSETAPAEEDVLIDPAEDMAEVLGAEDSDLDGVLGSDVSE